MGKGLRHVDTRGSMMDTRHAGAGWKGCESCSATCCSQPYSVQLPIADLPLHLTSSTTLSHAQGGTGTLELLPSR